MSYNEDKYIDITKQSTWCKNKTLLIPYNTNKIIKNIPDEIEEIIFENRKDYFGESLFNKPIEIGTFSNNIKIIIFCYSYNQEIKKTHYQKIWKY